MSAAFCHPRRLVGVLSLLIVCGGIRPACGQTSSSTPALSDHTVLRGKPGGGYGVVWSLAFARDGRTLAAGLEDKTVRLWDVTTGKELAVLRGHTDGVRSVAFSPDGRTLACGDRDGAVKLWSWDARGGGKLLAALDGHKDQVLSVAFSSDGKLLASGSQDGTVKMWDVAARKMKSSLDLGLLPGTGDRREPRRASAVAFSPSGKWLAAVLTDHTRLWDVKTGRQLVTLSARSRSSSFGAVGNKDATDWGMVAFLPGGAPRIETRGLVSFGFGGPREYMCPCLWNTTTGQSRSLIQVRMATARLPGRSAAVNYYFSDNFRTCALSPNGKLIATCGTETPYTGKEKTDEERLKAERRTRHNLVKLWDVARGRELASLEGHPRRHEIYAATFSPDGSLLATGGRDPGTDNGMGRSGEGHIRIWVVARALQPKKVPKRVP